MNIKQKLARVGVELDSIAQHDDADGAVVIGALEGVKALCDARIEAVRQRIADEVTATLGDAAPPPPAED